MIDFTCICNVIVAENAIGQKSRRPHCFNPNMVRGSAWPVDYKTVNVCVGSLQGNSESMFEAGRRKNTERTLQTPPPKICCEKNSSFAFDHCAKFGYVGPGLFLNGNLL